MKKMWPVLVVLILMGAFLWVAGTAAIAAPWCSLVENSFTLEIGDETFTLSDFTCIYGPGCEGTCECNGVTYPFTCNPGNISIAGLPAVLTEHGLILYVVPSGLHTLRIGDVVYMTEQEVPLLLFK